MKPPFKIFLIYLVLGTLWITLSDKLLLLFFSSDQVEKITEIQTYKGVFFIVSTAVLLFFMVQRHQSALIERVRELNLKNDLLKSNRDELSATKTQFRNIFDISPIPMWVFDWETLKFIAVNRAAIVHYGYSENEFLAMTIRDIRPPEDLPQLDRVLNDTVNSDNGYNRGRYRHKKKNGDLIVVDLKSDFIDLYGQKARIVLVNDITEMIKVEKSLRKAYQNILKVEDRERERIAGELHDGLIQNLVATKHFFSVLPIDEKDEMSEKFQSMISELIENSITECQRVIYDLRPKDLKAEGLEIALHRIIEKYNKVQSFQVHENIQSDIDELASENIKFNLYRIFQENLNNTIKYAKAQNAWLEIKIADDVLFYTFRDDGVGISDEVMKNESSFLSLKQRLKSIVGTFNVKSEVEKGTVFEFEIPLVLDEILVV